MSIYRIKVWINSTYHLIKRRFKKTHLKLVYSSWKSEPWDSLEIYKIELAKINEMINYFSKCYVVDNTYTLRDLNICKKLLDIIINYPDAPKSLNIKNIKRFYPPWDKTPEFIQYLKNEFYIKKAIHLYHLIRVYKEDDWWD